MGRESLATLIRVSRATEHASLIFVSRSKQRTHPLQQHAYGRDWDALHRCHIIEVLLLTAQKTSVSFLLFSISRRPHLVFWSSFSAHEAFPFNGGIVLSLHPRFEHHEPISCREKSIKRSERQGFGCLPSAFAPRRVQHQHSHASPPHSSSFQRRRSQEAVRFFIPARRRVTKATRDLPFPGATLKKPSFATGRSFRT